MIACAFGAAEPAAPAASSSVTVTLSVASHTAFDSTGCASSVAGVTDFGTVLPGTTAVTTSDCTISFGSGNDTARLLLYQQDGGGDPMFQRTFGATDTTFNAAGTPGKNRVDFSAAPDVGLEAAMQPDGKLVIGGRSNNGTNDDIAIMRFNADGTLDTKTRVDINGNDNGYAMTMQGAKPVVVGANNTPNDFLAVRFNADGTHDLTFNASGTPGRLQQDFNGGAEQAYAVATLPDGRLLLGGYTQNASNDWGILRLNADGSLDTSFNPLGTLPGRYMLDFAGGADAVQDIIPLQSGGYYVGGYVAGATSDFAVAKFLPSGVLDTTYNPGGAKPGIAVVDFGGVDQGMDISLDDAGRIVIAGVSNNGTNDDFGVARLTTGGLLDTATFNAASGTPGRIRIDFGNLDQAYNGFIEPGGDIVVAGLSNNGANNDFAIARLTSAGLADTTFNAAGTPGRMRVDYSGTADFGRWAVLARDGRLLLGGYSNNGANVDFAVVAFASTATVPPFGGSWASPGFGACLHTVANGASGVWPVAGSGNCTAALPASWRAVAGTASDGTAKVATTPAGTTTGLARLRFGAQPGIAQTKGTYVAPLTFEVLAPDA